ncbi:MAG TPA: tautomerase family protein [Bryocella sp.]|nr:tautomerase family protein [Bryocella sp.]
MSRHFHREYSGIQRSADCIVFQITRNGGRSVEQKQSFHPRWPAAWMRN